MAATKATGTHGLSLGRRCVQLHTNALGVVSARRSLMQHGGPIAYDALALAADALGFRPILEKFGAGLRIAAGRFQSTLSRQ